MYEFKPTNEFFKKFTSLVCGPNSILQPVCSNAIFMVTGFNKEQMDMVNCAALI